MLAYLLAIAVGLGSFALYMAAFFFPEVHRKDDFLWSGVGLFYALVLWVCAGRITGGVLLGQVAGVSLLGWFLWETVVLRRAISRPEERTEVLEGLSVTELIANQLDKISSLWRKKPKPKPQVKTSETATTIPPEVETAVEATLETPIEQEKEQFSTAEAETVILENPVGENLKESSAVEVETATQSTLETPVEEEIEESSEDEMDTVIERFVPTPVDKETEKNLSNETQTTPEFIVPPQAKATTQKKKGFFGQLIGKISSPFRKQKTEAKTTKEPVVASLSNVDLEKTSNDAEIFVEEILPNLEDVATEVEKETVAVNVSPTTETPINETETEKIPEVELEETVAPRESEIPQVQTNSTIEIEVTKIAIKATSETDLEELAAELETEIDRVEVALHEEEEEEETEATIDTEDETELAEFVSELEAEPETDKTDTIEVEIITTTVEEVVSQADDLPTVAKTEESIEPEKDKSEIKEEVKEPTSAKKVLPDYSLLKELDFDREPESDEDEPEK